MKRLTLSLFSLLLALCCCAQKQDVYFMKNNGSYVSVKDSADFIRIVSEPDSTTSLYLFADYYKDGKKKSIGHSIIPDYFSGEGTLLTYYNNGNKKTIENFVKGKKIGLQYAYYPNGKLYKGENIILKTENKPSNTVDRLTETEIVTCLDSTGKPLVTEGNGHYIGFNADYTFIELEGDVKNGKAAGSWIGHDRGLKVKYTEKYENGLLISGESVDSTGQKRSYTKNTESPEYRGGLSGVGNYLSANIHYPETARQYGIEGTVLLQFTIKKDGKVGDVKVLRHVSDDVDKEAVRVVSGMRGWMAGKKYGIPVNVRYNLPVAFNLR